MLWGRNLLLEPSAGCCWLTGTFPLSFILYVTNTPWPSRILVCSTLPPAQDAISSNSFPILQAELELSAAPTDHTLVSTSTWHCANLFRCLSFTSHPLHREILRAFFKGRNWVTLISASLGLAQGWTVSKQSTSFLEDSMKVIHEMWFK